MRTEKLIEAGWSVEGADFLMQHAHEDEGIQKLIARVTDTDYQRKRQQQTLKASIPPALRWLIWERDNFTCAACRSRRHLSIDHIIPESKGGTLDPENLRTLCCRCNSKKGCKV